jgi:hypothetical protein
MNPLLLSPVPVPRMSPGQGSGFSLKHWMSGTNPADLFETPAALSINAMVSPPPVLPPLPTIALPDGSAGAGTPRFPSPNAVEGACGVLGDLGHATLVLTTEPVAVSGQGAKKEKKRRWKMLSALDGNKRAKRAPSGDKGKEGPAKRQKKVTGGKKVLGASNNKASGGESLL